LEFPLWLVNPAVLFFGFFEYKFHFSNNSDITALLLYLTGLSVSLNLIKSGKSILKKTVIIGFLLGSTAFIKYLYIPLAFVPIISIWIYGYLINKREFRTAALKSFLFTFFIILSLLVFQYLNSGNSVYINPSETGFFPAQLLWLAPVVPSSFVNLNFINMQFSIRGLIPYETLNIFWSVVNLGCLGWLSCVAFKICREKILRSPDYRSFYAIHAILLTITLIGFLSVLSVIKGKKYPDSFETWVYLGELRYYLILSVLLLQFGLLVCIRPEYFFNVRRAFLLPWIFIFLLIEEAGHGIYFQIKQIVLKNSYGLRQQHDRIFFETSTLVKKLSKNASLVFTSNAQELANSAALQGVPILYDPGHLKIPVESSRTVTLIIAVDSRVPGQDIPILQMRLARPDLILNTVKFYILEIPKNTGI
jgi:hypothetical protein